MHDGDGTAACAFLAPATGKDLEDSGGQKCQEAILTQDLPDTQGLPDPRTRGTPGRSAGPRRCRRRGDVVFLSMFGNRWLVTAAGCTPRGDRPYDRALKGG